jgi:hypothetical protein
MAQSIVVKNRHQLAQETEDSLKDSGHTLAVDPEGSGATWFCRRTGYTLHSVGFDAEGRPQTWVFTK